ncbi:MAG: toll/interleukin-1 receptor domain-containing protein [Chloroflexota bacterium]
MSGMEEKKLLVFLSHASEDKKQVRNLCKRLKASGFDPWLDEERLLPGQDWNLEIESALRASDAILLCFSSLSVVKEGYIQREYKRAMKYLEEKPEGTIYAIPVRLDGCELPLFIREKQWVDYPADYDRLAQALQIRAGETAMPKKDSKPKEKKPASQRTAPKSSAGNVFNFHGSVNVQGAMIGGDQTNYYNNNQQTINITSPAQFMDELQKLKDEIGKLKSQPNVDPATARRMDLVQTDIDDVVNEANKEKPVAERIKTTLDGAKEVMDKVGGSVGSAVNLGTALGSLAMIAMKLFGG